MADSTIDGLISGLKTTDIIAQLMQVEQRPQAQLQTQRAAQKTVYDEYQTLSTRLTAIGDAAGEVSTQTGWRALNATSSLPDSVAAAASSGASAGSLTFTVGTLAAAHTLVSAQAASSLGVVIGSGNLLLSKAGGLGIGTLTGNAALALGAHTVEVTQASAAATKTGDTALDTSTDLGAGGTILVTVDGNAKTLNLAGGVYASRAALVTQINSAIATAGANLVASVGSNGKLQLASTGEGSAHSVQVTGGTALAALYLSTDGAALTGTDGVLEVDGTAVTVSNASSGATATANLAGGQAVTATLVGGLRVGTVTATNVSLGDGSLSSTVAAINSANSGIIATSVYVGTAGYRLQLVSSSTGAASTLTVDTSKFSAAMGTLNTLTAAADASLTIGSGPNAYTVSRAQNTVTDLLPGVTLQLNKADENTPVTVTIGRDAAGLADKAGKLVDAVNAAIAEVKAKGSYNATTKTGGPLLGDPIVTRLQQQLYGALADVVGSSSLGSPGAAGISLNKDGTVAFDRSKFLAAYDKDPEAVASLFRQGGTSGSALVQFSKATDTTRRGDYTVVVTQAATRSSVTGAMLASAPGDETVSLRIGTTTVSYAAKNGDSLDSIAAGLNSAIAAQSLHLVAGVESSKLVIRSSDYGSAGSFDVKSTGTGLGLVGVANAWEAHADGVDVAGHFLLGDGVTIVAATGIGQLLTAANDDLTLRGLSVKVTATAGDLPLSSSLAYAPGLAQRLATLVHDATDSVDGRLTLAQQGRQTEMNSLDKTITDWDTRLADRERELKRQFSDMEVALGKLRDQSNWLAGQIANLPHLGSAASG